MFLLGSLPGNELPSGAWTASSVSSQPVTEGGALGSPRGRAPLRAVSPRLPGSSQRCCAATGATSMPRNHSSCSSWGEVTSPKSQCSAWATRWQPGAAGEGSVRARVEGCWIPPVAAMTRHRQWGGFRRFVSRLWKARCQEGRRPLTLVREDPPLPFPLLWFAGHVSFGSSVPAVRLSSRIGRQPRGLRAALLPDSCLLIIAVRALFPRPHSEVLGLAHLLGKMGT